MWSFPSCGGEGGKGLPPPGAGAEGFCETQKFITQIQRQFLPPDVSVLHQSTPRCAGICRGASCIKASPFPQGEAKEILGM